MITQLINTELICLDLKATSKNDVFVELIELLYKQGRVDNKAQFLKDVQDRETMGNTGFEEGVAMPHAKSAAVIKPAVVIGISRAGIDYDAEDGQPSKLFFMIASPDKSSNDHIEVLAEISSKLIEEGFVDKLMAVQTKQQALDLLLQKTAPSNDNPEATKGFIIGVTGCPTGIAHTYLAAEALEKGAAALGYKIKVETNGSIGVKNSPTAEEIERADAIVVASDKQVELHRFAGKKLIETSVKAPITDAKGVINKALNGSVYLPTGKDASTQQTGTSDTRGNLYRYLMNGVSNMIPFVVTGGLLIALALAIGFIGAIVAGLLVGYFIKWLVSINFHKYIQPLVPIMIAPIAGSLFISGLFIFVIGAPIASLMDSMNSLLTNMSTGNVVLLGIVLGGMAGFDMGGPFNKVAFLFSVGMIASGQTQFMGAMACAIPVVPLGMGLATVLGRKLNLFEASEIEAGKAAGAMGLVGISEGAIPFAAQDPLSVIPANVLGSMVAAVMAFSFGITNSVAHGGPIVALLGAMNKPLLALLCMVAGAVVTAIVCITLKKMRFSKVAKVA